MLGPSPDRTESITLLPRGDRFVNKGPGGVILSAGVFPLLHGRLTLKVPLYTVY